MKTEEIAELTVKEVLAKIETFNWYVYPDRVEKIFNWCKDRFDSYYSAKIKALEEENRKLLLDIEQKNKDLLSISNGAVDLISENRKLKEALIEEVQNAFYAGKTSFSSRNDKSHVDFDKYFKKIKAKYEIK